MSRHKQYGILCTTCLLLGGGCYFFLRPDTYVSQIFSSVFKQGKQSAVAWKLAAGGYLGDFFWGMALCFAFLIIHDPGKRVVVSAWCGASFLCGCLWELMQFLGIVNGTADVVDIAIYLLAGVFSVIISEKVRKEK